jgi:general secretion pathway protein C
MPQTRLTTWMSRLSPRVPQFVSITFGVLIAAELAHATLGIVRAGSAPAVMHAPGNRYPRAQTDGVDVANIVAARLFGTAPGDPQTRDAATRSADAKLVLTGTFASQDPGHGNAIISTDGGTSMVYSVGQSVAGASLASVFFDHVLLRRNGNLENLKFPKLLSGAITQVQQAHLPQRSARLADEGPTDAAPHSPQTLGELAQMTPTAVGGRRGFRVYNSSDPEAFKASGLRPGDLVTSINGTSLQDQPPQVAQQLLNSVQPGGTSVTVMRGGRPTVINLNLHP